MRFTCETKALAKAVSAAAKAVDPRGHIPALQNLYLEATDCDQVRIVGTDLETTITIIITAKVEENGNTTVPAKAFAAYLKSTAGNIHVVSDENAVRVQNGSSVSAFKAGLPNEFPVRAHMDGAAVLDVDGKDFAQAVKAVSFAASQEELRGAVLMGVLLSVEGSKAQFIATDGHRLAEIDFPAVVIRREACSFIIPGSALETAVQIISSKERIWLWADKTYIQFQAGGVTLHVRLVDGQYPNYKAVIPAKFDAKYAVDRTALLASVERIGKQTEGKNKSVALDFTDRKIRVGLENGNSYDEIETDGKGAGRRLLFNAELLAGILKHLVSAQVRFDTVAIDKAVQITPCSEGNVYGAADEGQRYVIMPQRQGKSD